jgi:hypothetical protein
MSVRVHSCQQSNDDGNTAIRGAGRTFVRDIKHLNPKRFYYTTDQKFESFKPLPLKCVCRKFVTDLEAVDFLAQGKALPIFKPSGSSPVSLNDIDDTQIIMLSDRPRTPRVDLVPRADMERAYNKLGDPFFRSSAETLEEARKELDLKCADPSYRLIEEIQLMILEEREKLMVPFQDDPDAMYDSTGILLPGRILFPFGPDQRTEGGHS